MPRASNIFTSLLLAAAAIALIAAVAGWLARAEPDGASEPTVRTAGRAEPGPSTVEHPAAAQELDGDPVGEPEPSATDVALDREAEDRGSASSDSLDSLETLDHASSGQIEMRLGRAIERAREERGAKIADGLVEQLIEHGDVRVIVARPMAREKLAPQLQGSRYGKPRYFHNIPYAALAVGPQALLTLVESAEVSAIERDTLHAPSLNDSIPAIGADVAAAAGYDGDGWVIAVIDTGVQTDHPFFADRLIDGACFSYKLDCPNGEDTMFGIDAGASCDFSCAHGTYVAGVALGYDDAQPLSGVAPAASLISIQVFSETDPGTPRAYTSDIIAGLDHVYGLRFSYQFAAVNLSLGGDLFNNAADCDAENGARKAIIDQLRTAGIPTVASSGNDGFTDLITAPGCISSVIAVGATNSSGAVGSYSNSSNDVDLLAPGSFIRTSTPVDQFRSVTGTSMSTPHVTGAIANILVASPTSSVDDILHALEVTGVPVTDERNSVTRPRIDIPDAIDFLLDGGTADPPEEPTADDPPAPGPPSDDCGLVGLELLVPLLLTRASLRRRRSH